MVFCISDAVYTGFWAVAGSVLGFFAFRRNPDMDTNAIVRNCFLSIGIGLLVAYPITEYLFEIKHLSKRLSIMLGTIGAFGLPDIILKYYPVLTQAVATKVVDEIADKTINMVDEKHHRDDE